MYPIFSRSEDTRGMIVDFVYAYARNPGRLDSDWQDGVPIIAIRVLIGGLLIPVLVSTLGFAAIPTLNSFVDVKFVGDGIVQLRPTSTLH